MIRPTPQVLRALANVARDRDIMDFLQSWRMHELENLPQALNNPALAQGRCQVLGELFKLITEAPNMAAKPQPSGTPSNSTHTDRSV